MDEVIEQLVVQPKPQPSLPPDPTPKYRLDTIYYHHSKVDAMLTTKWGQSGIYGNLCPNGLAGCSNTAAVQIMAYHKHPTLLFTTYLGVNNFDAINIDWDSILLHTEGIGTYSFALDKYVCNCGCNHEHISIIMREIGYRSSTNYGNTGSGADELAIRNVLYLLGFGNPIHVEGVSFDDYQAVIFEELDNNRPMYVSGFKSTGGGHAWVVDGYEYEVSIVDYYKVNPNYNSSIIYNPVPKYIYDHTDEREEKLLHFNWGWDGNCDGWFVYGSFAPGEGSDYDDDSENNNDDRDYNTFINLVYQIQVEN